MDTDKIKTSDSDTQPFSNSDWGADTGSDTSPGLVFGRASFIFCPPCFEDVIRDAGFSFQNSGGQIFIPDNMISVVRQYDGTVKSISG